MIEYVIKRDGRREPFDADKLNNWAQWSEKTINPRDFNWSGIVLRTVSLLGKECTAKQLQDTLIKECLNQNTWESNRMAGRLYASALSKELYETRKHPHIKELHDKLINLGVIVKPNYTDEEYEYINKLLNHKRDFTYSHYAINQLIQKYSLRDRVKKVSYETPQFIYMRVVMDTLNFYTKEDRLEKLKDLYEELSLQRVVVPTPYFANSLTRNPNKISCSVITCTDEAESIGILNTLAYTLTTSGAGVGAHMKTRSINDPVRGGLVKHAGKVPYYRAFANIMKSSTQGCYDPETEVLTESGWKFFKDISKEDLIVQVNDNLGLSYTKPLHIFKYEYEGDMYSFSGENTDLLVTPNHRMVYMKSGEAMDGLRIRTAEELEDRTLLVDIKPFEEFIDVFSLDFKLETPSTTVISNWKGIVYCVEVETGILIVRRNGKTAICGNSRSGAATMYFPIFDPEIEVLTGLKNPLSVLANRVRDSDYGFSINKPFLKRAFTGKPFWLFSYKDNPELYEKFYHWDSETFDKELEQFAKDNPDKVAEVDAKQLLSTALTHRIETGRLYPHFADITNFHTPYKETIYSSNLCAEISNVTKPYKTHLELYSDNPEGVVGFCNLAGINLGVIKDDEEYEKACYYALFMIEQAIETASLPFPALNKNLKDYRSAGVGICSLAYLMAKNNKSYITQEGRDFIFEQAERHQYFLTKAAIKLTEELGPCEAMARNKYKDGWLPFDSTPKAVFDLVTVGFKYDWEPLRERMKELGGLRFTTLSCIMPAESSSIAVSGTNSLYPLRDLTLVKTSGDTTNIWVAPEASRLAKKYEIVWDIPSEHMINLYALWQVFIDQSISADTFVDRTKNVNLSMSSMFKDLAQCAKLNVKTLYYMNTLTDKKDTFEFLNGIESEEEPSQINEDVGCSSGGCTL